MAELSVTRAAERLGRTQSAVSHSLARLRQQLGDPLLLKGARRMEPTPFALELLERGAADPARPAARAVAAPTLRAQELAPRLPAGRARLHPGAVHRPDGRPCAPRPPESPSNGRRRARPCCSRSPTASSMPPSRRPACACPAACWPSRSARSAWRCFGRRGHPAFARWGVRAWARWPHLVVRVGDRLDSPVECRRLGRRTQAHRRRLGAELLGGGAGAGRQRPARHPARARPGRHGQAMGTGVASGAVRPAAAAACPAVECEPHPRSRDRLAAQQAPADRQAARIKHAMC